MSDSHVLTPPKPARHDGVISPKATLDDVILLNGFNGIQLTSYRRVSKGTRSRQ